MMRSKFNAKKVKIDGMVFDSKREYKRYCYLLELEKEGKISNLQRQVKFDLLPKQKGERAVTYIADHVYIDSNILVVEDVKSKITKKQPDYIIKRKMFKYFYCKNNEKAEKMFKELKFESVIFQEIE